jgi:hypothetical protein
MSVLTSSLPLMASSDENREYEQGLGKTLATERRCPGYGNPRRLSPALFEV